MFGCLRLRPADDDNSHSTEGFIDLERNLHGDSLDGKPPATTMSFQQTASRGRLDFATRGGRHFTLKPGDVLPAEDTAGRRWKPIDDQPWRWPVWCLRPG